HHHGQPQAYPPTDEVTQPRPPTLLAQTLTHNIRRAQPPYYIYSSWKEALSPPGKKDWFHHCYPRIETQTHLPPTQHHPPCIGQTLFQTMKSDDLPPLPMKSIPCHLH